MTPVYTLLLKDLKDPKDFTDISLPLRDIHGGETPPPRLPPATHPPPTESRRLVPVINRGSQTAERAQTPDPDLLQMTSPSRAVCGITPRSPPSDRSDPSDRSSYPPPESLPQNADCIRIIQHLIPHPPRNN